MSGVTYVWFATADRIPAAYPELVSDFPEVRLHVVTGKGGTGKTTVAAATAVAKALREAIGSVKSGK